MSAGERIMDSFRAAGLPVSGWCRVAGPHETANPATFHVLGGGTVRVDWASQPTSAQETEAGNVLTGRPLSRTPKTRAAIRSEVEALLPTDRQSLLTSLIVEQILEDPLWAKRRGVDIEGDF